MHFSELKTPGQSGIPPSKGRISIAVTRGCHWNRCRYCTLFKGIPFSIKPMEHILRDISRMGILYQDTELTSCILREGDTLGLRTQDLLKILQALKASFPFLKSVSTYARPGSIIRKSLQELNELREAGLNHFYCAMESGSEKILTQIGKGYNVKDVIESGLLAKGAKITLSEFILLGAGGQGTSTENALYSAQVLNEIAPDYIHIQTAVVKHTTDLGRQVASGEYKLASEEAMVQELKFLLENLQGIHTTIVNRHKVNLLTEVQGTLPQDRGKMLQTLEEFFSLGSEDKKLFIMGRRMGNYRTLKDFHRRPQRTIIGGQIQRLERAMADVGFDRICNDFRCDML